MLCSGLIFQGQFSKMTGIDSFKLHVMFLLLVSYATKTALSFYCRIFKKSDEKFNILQEVFIIIHSNFENKLHITTDL